MDAKAQGTLVGECIADHWVLDRRLGGGSFGEIYEASDANGTKFAVKTEKHNARCPQLRHECKVYRELEGADGVSTVHHFGHLNAHSVLVLDLLGPSLEEMFTRCGRRLSLRTTLQLADQMLERVEMMHERHLIHRDIKPANFTLGAPLGVEGCQRVSAIDFGLSKRFRNPRTLAHIPYKDGKSLTGTPRYASISNHMGMETSRRDDLESIGYVLVYFVAGELPWQGVRAATPQQKHQLILEKKLGTPIETLCDQCPAPFAEYLRYCRSLKFEAKPDVSYLRNLFRDYFRQVFGVDYSFTSYDWTTGIPLSTQTLSREAALAQNIIAAPGPVSPLHVPPIVRTVQPRQLHDASLMSSSFPATPQALTGAESGDGNDAGEAAAVGAAITHHSPTHAHTQQGTGDGSRSHSQSATLINPTPPNINSMSSVAAQRRPQTAESLATFEPGPQRVIARSDEDPVSPTLAPSEADSNVRAAPSSPTRQQRPRSAASKFSALWSRPKVRSSEESRSKPSSSTQSQSRGSYGSPGSRPSMPNAFGSWSQGWGGGGSTSRQGGRAVQPEQQTAPQPGIQERSGNGPRNLLRYRSSVSSPNPPRQQQANSASHRPHSASKVSSGGRGDRPRSWSQRWAGTTRGMMTSTSAQVMATSGNRTRNSKSSRTRVVSDRDFGASLASRGTSSGTAPNARRRPKSAS